MAIKYTGEALLGLHLSKKQKEALFQEARKSVADEVWGAACKEAERKILFDISKDPESNKAIWDFAVETVTPLVSSRYMGYGMQAMMDGIFLALRDRGWSTSRGEKLIKDSGAWINKMSDAIFDEFIEAVNNGDHDADGKEDSNPVKAKHDIDEGLRVIYGQYFQPWDSRYKEAGDGSEKSFVEYREMEDAKLEARKETNEEPEAGN